MASDINNFVIRIYFVFTIYILYNYIEFCGYFLIFIWLATLISFKEIILYKNPVFYIKNLKENKFFNTKLAKKY